MRRPLYSSFHLCSGEVANPDHADIAVGPSLLRRPLDKVMHVMAFLTVKKAKGSAGTTGPATIRYDVRIAARNEEVACARFNEARGSAKVLNLSRIGGRGNKYWVSPGFRWTVHVCQQRNAIA